MVIETKCPICRAKVRSDEAEFPFCSERCRLVDLGNWSSEAYRIPGERVEEPPRPNGFARHEDEEE
jgi:uncharacterized protein